MKRIFLLSILVLALFSCKKDDNNGSEINGNVVGKWRLITHVINGENEPIENKNNYLDLKDDYTFKEYDNYGYYVVGNWRQAQGKLEFNYDMDKTNELYPNQGVIFIPEAYTISKLDDKTMGLKGEFLGFDAILTYQKIN